jgi:hypothetical protein
MRIIASGLVVAACLLASCTAIPASEIARAKADGVPVLFEYAEPCSAQDSSTGCKEQFVVTADRPIRYLRSWWTPISPVGEPAIGRCLDCDGGLPHGGVVTGPLRPGTIVPTRSKARWSGPITCFRLDRCEVEFMDGETQGFSGESVGRVLASTFRQCPKP